MCGRLTIRLPAHALKEALEVEDLPPEGVPERFNVAPTQPVPVVRAGPAGRRLDLLRWGLLPAWAKDARLGARLINARSETAATTPAFRAAFARRRCLVVCDGFYEWHRPTRAAKQAFHLRRPDGGPLALAGLWERWGGPPGAPLPAPVETCAILTVPASAAVARIHDRMPAVLEGEALARWLDPGEALPEALGALLRPWREDGLVLVPVGDWVNDARHEGPRCLAPPVEAPAAPPRDPPGQATLFP